MWTGTDWIFTAVYGLGFLLLLATEVVGIRRKEPNDTITENWRKLDKNLHGPLQWGWRVLTVGLLGWAILHLPFASGQGWG
jgi:hypothetical protein